jgi:hypothetical protein
MALGITAGGGNVLHFAYFVNGSAPRFQDAVLMSWYLSPLTWQSKLPTVVEKAYLVTQSSVINQTVLEKGHFSYNGVST